MDDQVLVSRVIEADDQHAFAELVKRYQSQLRYSLRQITGWDEALADDLAQETFIKAYKAIRQFRGDAKFFTWLYRIAYNCFLAHRRTLKPEDTLGERELPESGRDQEGELALHRDLAHAMAKLSPDQRMALHLFLHREMSHQEIAEVMNCPLGTVKSHIQRGRQRLQESLSDWKEETST